MPKVYKYTKKIDAFTTHTIAEPDYKEDEDHITELCTIDEITYVSVPDSVVLPSQSGQVTVEEVILTEELKIAIRKESVHYQLIEERIKTVLPKMKPEEGRYFMLSFDPIKMEAKKAEHLIGADTKNLKTALSPHLKGADKYVAEIEQWGIEQKDKLGLGEVKEK